MPSGTTHQPGRHRSMSCSREAREMSQAAVKKMKKKLNSRAETKRRPRTLPDRAGPSGKRRAVARKKRPSAGHAPMMIKWTTHRQRGVWRIIIVGIGGGDSDGSDGRAGWITPPAFYFR